MYKKLKKEQKIYYTNKRTAVLYVVLRMLVILTMVAQFLHGNYNNVFMCILTLILFMIPVIVDHRLNIKLPSALETVILLFIFAAEILGEIQSFYTIIPYWDTMLHTINGFLMAAFGFAMIDVLNRSPKIHISMSPIFVAFVAFCFSMTVGVVWEFFEYFMDTFVGMDMQKDWIVNGIVSAKLNPDGLNEPVVIKDITATIVHGTINGKAAEYYIDGYLDVGTIDTMKDLLVNCIGAIVFSVIGVFYLKQRDKGGVAEAFIPQLKTEEEIRHTREMIEEIRAGKKKRRK